MRTLETFYAALPGLPFLERGCFGLLALSAEGGLLAVVRAQVLEDEIARESARLPTWLWLTVIQQGHVSCSPRLCSHWIGAQQGLETLRCVWRHQSAAHAFARRLRHDLPVYLARDAVSNLPPRQELATVLDLPRPFVAQHDRSIDFARLAGRVHTGLCYRRFARWLVRNRLPFQDLLE